MKSTKLLNGLMLCLGLILLLLPLTLFHGYHFDMRAKLAALKYLSVSLIGIALVTLALWSSYRVRRELQKSV